ncbi:hypothetical protein CHS0354_012436 [Potamilus streckersoni]|uniref:Inositol polyphosphate-related phosphatase domain-containing protein n=1 Tax=Potamilus streckersoni TaxID=2493646 RepID=A0AAE0RVQ1_9BIVA|nr:hypothetical protein CHS0354_012436 [Potamilus streckersoni]
MFIVATGCYKHTVRFHQSKQLICNILNSVYCVEGTTEVNDQNCQRFVCLITRQGDYAVCILSSLRIPCLHSDDLIIETVLPVDENLRTKLDPATNDKPDSKKRFVLTISNDHQGYKFELSEGETIQQFLTELKQARDLLSQNACFGLPSSFIWLEKYQKKKTYKSENPFENDTFDPLAHMGIDLSQCQLASAKQSRASFIDEISYACDDLPGMRERSSSKDSLDALDSSYFTQSIETIHRNHPYTGITSGLQLDSEERSTLGYREKLLKYYLDKRETEFTRATTFRVFCGTWNVNGQSPPLAVESLRKWLAVDKDPPDIYAIGFQELDLSSQALIFTESVKEDEWQRAVQPCLHPKARYRKVKSIRLVGVLLIVFIKTEHVDDVSLIDTDSVPTGILGIMGNKGGVGIRFTIQNTSLCFVNSHLAAHQEEIDRRNQDYKDIESKMRFKQFFPPLTIADHDVIFWIGDLNYRVDMDINTVHAFIKEEQFKPLLNKDQLLKQLGKEHKDVFRGFKEGPVTFPPTYKFDPNTDTYDTSEKSRIPAWCDRILWKGKGIKQLAYRSHHILKISDHKPVSSIFDVEIRVIDPDKHKKVYEDIMRKLDREENDYLPQVSLGQREFVFKDVKFIEPREQFLPIANIGQVPVNFEFINKLDEKRYGKPWLSVNPPTNFITPGDSMEVAIEIYVDKKTVGKLNSGEDKLDDILVLHLHGGKDFFISFIFMKPIVKSI